MLQNNNFPSNQHKPFAEVVESSLVQFKAQAWQWDAFAEFGSLVTVESKQRIIIGIVYDIQTGSIDPQRYPFAYQKTESELLAEQPQIFSFLKTTFSCLILGYYHKGKIYYTLSPEPPKIHAFVQPAQADLLKTFLYQELYLHIMFNAAQHIHNIDELLLALLKQKKILGILSAEKIHALAQTFSLLTGNDYRRLKLFLQRAQALVDHV